MSLCLSGQHPAGPGIGLGRHRSVELTRLKIIIHITIEEETRIHFMFTRRDITQRFVYPVQGLGLIIMIVRLLMMIVW